MNNSHEEVLTDTKYTYYLYTYSSCQHGVGQHKILQRTSHPQRPSRENDKIKTIGGQKQERTSQIKYSLIPELYPSQPTWLYAVLTWNMVKGDSSCALYRSRNLGMSISKRLVPYMRRALSTAASVGRPLHFR